MYIDTEQHTISSLPTAENQVTQEYKLVCHNGSNFRQLMCVLYMYNSLFSKIVYVYKLVFHVTIGLIHVLTTTFVMQVYPMLTSTSPNLMTCVLMLDFAAQENHIVFHSF